MIKDFINKYGQLSDSWINQVIFSKSLVNGEEKIEVQIIINCSNIVNDYKYETVKIFFSNIESLSFIDNEELSNFSPKDVLIKNDDGNILFDFDAIDCFDYLEENLNSAFKIKARDFRFIGNIDNLPN